MKRAWGLAIVGGECRGDEIVEGQFGLGFVWFKVTFANCGPCNSFECRDGIIHSLFASTN